MAGQTFDYIVRVRGATDASVNQAIGELKKFANAQEDIVVSAEKVTRAQISIERAFQNTERRYVEGLRQLQELERVQRLVNTAIELNPSLQDRANRVLEAATAKYKAQADAMEKMRLAQESVNSAQNVNQRLNVRDNFATQDRAADIAAYGKALDDLKAKFNPLFAAQRAYQQRLEEINQAQKVGAITEKERKEEMARATTEFQHHVNAVRAAGVGQKSLADSTKLSRYELINLSRQIQDVGVGLASGQSPFTVLIQQGTQIADVFAASQVRFRDFFSNAIGWAGRFVTSATGVVTSIVGIGVAAVAAAADFRSAQTDISRALLGIGRQSGATAGDIERIAGASATPGGLSTREARAAALELAKTGEIGVKQIEELAKHTFALSKIIGVDLTEANKLWAASFADPAKGVDELGDKLGGVTAKVREEVKTLAAQFRFDEARTVLLQSVVPTLERAATVTSGWSSTWTKLTNVVSDFWTAFGKGVDRAFGNTGVGEQLGQIEERMEELLRRRRETESGPAVSMVGTGGRAAALVNLDKQIESTRKEQEKLNAEFRKENELAASTDLTGRINKLAALGQALAPGVAQLHAMENALKALNTELAKPEIRAGLGPQQLEALTQIQRVLESSTGFARQARQEFQGVSTEVAIQLKLTKDQISAVEAIGTGRRLEAQQAALVSQFLAQNKTLDEARRLAAQQIALIRAQEVASTREAAAAARDALGVAQARGAAAKIEAQTIAEIESARRQFAGNEEAIQQATEAALDRQAAAYEQIQESAEQQLRSLQQQNQLINATSEEERARIQSQQTLVNLMEQGVDAMTAQSIASQQLRNNLDQAARAAERAEEAASQAARNMRSVVPTGARPVGSDFGPNTGTTGSGQFQLTPPLFLVRQLEELQKQGLDAEIKFTGDWKSPHWFLEFRETSDSLRRSVNEMLKGGSSIDQIIRDINSRPDFVNPVTGDPMFPSDIKFDLLLDLMRRQTEMSGSPEQEIALLKQQIGQVSREPRSLEQMDLLKTLNDRLKELTESTEQLNDTMQIGLDPIYTQGHQALKIGYYDERGGGMRTGTGWTSPTTSSGQRLPGIGPATTMPTQPPPAAPPPYTPPGPIGPNPGWGLPYEEMVRRFGRTGGLAGPMHFAQGGIMGPDGVMHYQYGGTHWGKERPEYRSGLSGKVTNTPSLFSTSENYHPEAIIPLQNGAVPVVLSGGGGDTVQSRTTVVNVTVAGGTSMGDRRTRRQIAQGVGRAVAGAM